MMANGMRANAGEPAIPLALAERGWQHPEYVRGVA
jgi:hypothetical protein